MKHQQRPDRHHRTVLLGVVGVALLYGVVIQVALTTWWPTPRPNPLPVAIGARGSQDASLGGHVAASDENPQHTPYRSTKQTGSAAVASTTNAPLSSRSALPPGKVFRDKVAQVAIIDNITYPLRTYKPLALPNDPSANQWWVTNSRLDQAWGVAAGGHQTTLAIIDTGFGLKHEEFANRLYVNSGESGATASEGPSQRNCQARGLPLDADCNLIDDDADGTVDNEDGEAYYQNPSRLNCTDQGKPLDKSCNRLDDDGNGLVDDVSGWDFANNDNSSQAGELNPSGTGTTHGTRTMGVAAATGNNGKGIAGADWQTKILPIQALDDDSYGDTLGVGRAIYYAASQHADVISISLGSVYSDDFVRQAIQYASQQGSVVVAAAGNDGCNCITYPANYPEVVAVGALDTNNQPTSFSSYGNNLDILAPGVGITSTNWTAGNGTSAYASNLAGTSFSTPMVAGLMSRLLSQQSAATPLQLIAALTENANRLNLPAGTSRNNTLGFGKLDGLTASLRMATPHGEQQQYTYNPVSHGNVMHPGAPDEPVGTYAVTSCPAGINGTTPLFDMTRSGTEFFTVSQVEAWVAQEAGYQSRLVTYSCLTQPHDGGTVAVRPLNLFTEIRNLTVTH